MKVYVVTIYNYGSLDRDLIAVFDNEAAAEDFCDGLEDVQWVEMEVMA
jgi:hypothetical protein